ncbi:DUF3990 domain-containing protein [uncultured Parabacteroides sp.]|uniref:DUF3990 domain-containing protein n=1 Tax=uncultured Parabacteroides sp. TaxID=512312 RepID=UPI00259B60D4|nr:DUF3990 domain-containing protein [uncultured Parabacteroides sp.]
MKVYHGSTFCVELPLACVCRDNLDFGKGFYVTDLKEQAVSWALRIAAITKMVPYLNVYEMDMELVRNNYQVLTFDSYNDDWLDFVISCRRGIPVWRDYDVVEGGIANDRVFNTVELYFSNLIGKEEALKRLSFEYPNRQLCLINQEMIDNNLKFVEFVNLSEKGGLYVSGK